MTTSGLNQGPRVVGEASRTPSASTSGTPLSVPTPRPHRRRSSEVAAVARRRTPAADPSCEAGGLALRKGGGLAGGAGGLAPRAGSAIGGSGPTATPTTGPSSTAAAALFGGALSFSRSRGREAAEAAEVATAPAAVGTAPAAAGTLVAAASGPGAGKMAGAAVQTAASAATGAAAATQTPSSPPPPPPDSTDGTRLVDSQGGGAGGKRRSGKPTETVTLTLVSFAVTRRAYSRIVPAWSRRYEAETGVRVRFRQSFGGSGAQARAVIDGMPADIAALALPLDLIKIAQAGLTSADWASHFPRGAVISESVASIVTRAGNPLGVTGWDDLTRPDVRVVMANPRTAGVARWIFFALWGHRLAEGEEAATEYVLRVLRRVVLQPRDAREASDVFYKQGKGDVLLTYENEARFTNAVSGAGNELPFVSPDNNVRIQCPAALVERNLDLLGPVARRAAEDFVGSLFQIEAQRHFVSCGFRSHLPEAEALAVDAPPVRDLWCVEDRVGPWETLQKKFFDDGSIYYHLQKQVAEERIRDRQAGIKLDRA